MSKKLYLTLSEISRMFDSPKGCCDDFKIGAYLSDKDGKDILMRRKRYEFLIRVHRLSLSDYMVKLGEIMPAEHIVVPETEELPMLGFPHDAKTFMESVREALEDIGAQAGLDWEGAFSDDYKGPREVTSNITIDRDPDHEFLGIAVVNIAVK